jgi:hypothetical protein
MGDKSETREIVIIRVKYNQACSEFRDNLVSCLLPKEEISSIICLNCLPLSQFCRARPKISRMMKIRRMRLDRYDEDETSIQAGVRYLQALEGFYLSRN